MGGIWIRKNLIVGISAALVLNSCAYHLQWGVKRFFYLCTLSLKSLEKGECLSIWRDFKLSIKCLACTPLSFSQLLFMVQGIIFLLISTHEVFRVDYKHTASSTHSFDTVLTYLGGATLRFTLALWVSMYLSYIVGHTYLSCSAKVSRSYGSSHTYLEQRLS